MKHVVYGAGGFLGGYLCRYLDVCKHECLAITRSECDLAVDEIKDEFAGDVAWFLPANVHISHPKRVWRDTILSAYRFVERARDLYDRVVLVSTSAVYGRDSADVDVPMEEMRPKGLYGVSKLMQEVIFSEAISDMLVTQRLLHVYGLGSKGLVEKLMGLALSGKSINVYGAGLTMQDLMCVHDLIPVMILSAEELGVHVFGTGNGMSVFDVAQVIKGVTGCRVVLRDDVPEHGNSCVMSNGTKVVSPFIERLKTRRDTGDYVT